MAAMMANGAGCRLDAHYAYRTAMSRLGAGALRLLISSPYGGQVITYEWRGQFSNAEIGALHAQGFGGRQAPERGWQAQVECHSLGWVCARDGGGMAGFVNVAWDGGIHAFILDTVVASHLRHQRVGTGLVTVALQESRAAGCEWLHVDFEDDLRGFYLGTCGFQATSAGLIAL